MAFKIHPARGSALTSGPVSDINVTPLVDVMLVLLIVFMVAAPMMATGVKVDLPTSNAAPLEEPRPPIVLSLDARGDLFLDQSPVTLAELVTRVEHAATEGKEHRIHLRADQGITYGKVIEAMGLLNEAGYGRIALVSEAPGAK